MRMNEAKCYIFIRSCEIQQENEMPHRKSWKCCVCEGLQNKMHLFREYFLSFTTRKITEKVDLSKKSTGKTSAILCRRYDNCLEAANLYSRTIKPITKTCVF